MASDEVKLRGGAVSSIAPMVLWMGGTARQPGSTGADGPACAEGCSSTAGRDRLHGQLIGIVSASPSARQRKLLGKTQITLAIGVF